MSTANPIFEIEPFRHELEGEGRFPRGGGGASRGPRSGPKPWPSFRKRRDLRTPGIYGGGYPPAYADREPGTEPASAASSEYVRWLQSTLNSATGGALPIDGVMSSSVRSAIRDFQRKNRLPASGYIGPDTEAVLRRVSGATGGNELEFEWEFELSGDAQTADSALSASNATTVASVLKTLKGQVIPGLYRFHAANRKFYTGMAMDLRKRILQHAWCLSHLGSSIKRHRLAVYQMAGKSEPQVRDLERKINEHHRANNPTMTLNQRAELELQELLEI